MTTTTLKVKAVCLILLLAGQEAFRIQGAARTTLAVKKSLKHADPGPAETLWNEASERCTWKLLKVGCAGDGCKFRPLPLDTSLSESCRLSDDYMLSNESTRDQFVQLAAWVLEEKSEKFQSGCADMKFWELKKRMYCHRRAGRMFRSAELISKAAQESFDDANQQRVERALGNIAGAFGEDGKYILQYKEKAKGDILNIAKNPTGEFKKMITTVSNLLSGSEATKNEAKQSIEAMPSKNVTKATKHDEKQIKRETERLARKYKLRNKGHVKKVWSDLEQVIPTEPTRPPREGSSLVQGEGQASYVGFNAMIVIIILVLILLLILPALGVGVGVSALTVLIVVLVLILIVMLVRILINGIRGLGGAGRRNTKRGKNRGRK